MPAASLTISSLSLIGSGTLSDTAVPGMFGGLSGIAYDESSNTYQLVSDFESRVFTVQLAIDAAGNSVTPSHLNGTETSTGLNITGGFTNPDTEGLARDRSGNLFVSSEGAYGGGIPANLDSYTLTENPFIKRFDANGNELLALTLPSRYTTSTTTTGPRINLALESLTLTPNDQYLFTALEGPLKQDLRLTELILGAAPLNRIVRFDLSGGIVANPPSQEFVYVADPGFGLSELLAIDNSGERLLAIERAADATTGALTGVRVYELSLTDATDISGIEALNGSTNGIATAHKEILVDFADLPPELLANYEGITFGPLLPDGRRSLVLVSDDNRAGATRFTTFAINEAPTVVSIAAIDADAAEAGQDPGTFRISRTGGTTNSLTVNYTIATGAGQATSDDYTPTLTGSVVIPIGQSFVDITLTPVDDALVEGSETVQINLAPGNGYVTAYNPTTPFVPAASVSVAIDGTSPNTLVVGDLNGDGKLDLITGVGDSGTVLVRWGNGAGDFSGGTTLFGVGGGSYGVAVGDMNGDGHLDVVFTSTFGSQVGIFLNDSNGQGLFAANPDIRLDVGFDPYAVAVGDLDGDGDLDLAVANNSDSTVSILLNQGNGVFTSTAVAVGTAPMSVVLGDFDGNGKLDFATANNGDNTVSIFLNQGNGIFTSSANVAVGTAPTSVALGDFDGNGRLDFATANSGDGTVSIRLGNGMGGFTGSTNVAVGPAPFSVAVGDFNSDGKLDFATANNGNGTVSIRLGDGMGGFTGNTSVLVGGNPSALALGDANGDGRLDILTGPFISGSQVAVLLANNPNATVAIADNDAPVPGLLNGPSNSPDAVGATDTNDDFTNLSSNVPANTTPGIPFDPNVVAFTNTVRNTGGEAANVSLRPTLPASADDVPPGTLVTISANGGATTATYLYNGSVFQFNGGTGIVGGNPISANNPVRIDNLAPNGTANYTVTIDLPPGTPLSTDANIQRGFPVTITAFIDSNGNGAVDVNDAAANNTINRVYTGFLQVVTQTRILQGTGPAVQGTDGTLSTTPKAPLPGNIIEYVTEYRNISEGQPANGSGNGILTASNVVLTQDGILGVNNWAEDDSFDGVLDTSHVVGSAQGSGGTLVFFSGNPSTTPATNATSGTTAATDVTRYVNTLNNPLAPGASGTFIIQRSVNPGGAGTTLNNATTTTYENLNNPSVPISGTANLVTAEIASLPTVNLSVSANAGSEADTTVITVTATVSRAVSGNQTVTVDVSGLGITTGDYSLSNGGVITIADGETTGSVTFTVVDDIVAEAAETAILTISNPSSGITLGSTISQTVTIAQNDFVVTNTNDSGEGSLRQAILNADANPGADTITFAGVFTDSDLTNDTIITSGLTLNSDITLQGAGANVVIERAFGSGVFTVNTGATAAFNNLTISKGNYGILNFGTISSITNTTFRDAQYEGINNQMGGTITLIDRSTIHRVGIAGIYNGGTIGNLQNSTISGNQYYGIYNQVGTLTLTNSTIAANGTAGVVNDNGTITANNTLFVGNGADGTSNTLGTIGSSNNLSGTFAGLGVDSTLANNGGSTQTHALLPGSQAINIGNNALLPPDSLDLDNDGNTTEPSPFDQRGLGFDRVVGGTVDVGAFEAPVPSVNLSVSVNSGTEADTTVITVTATASGAVVGPQTVTVGVSGTGITTGDYSLSNGGVITIADGETTGSITFTVANDAIAEDTEIATLTLSNPSSGLVLGDTLSQTIAITDNDTAGLILPKISANVTEGSTTDTYTMVLRSQPTADVIVTLISDGQVSTNVPSLTFTAQNWNVPQTVTITAVDDAATEGFHLGNIDHSVSSADGKYNGLSTSSVVVLITDNDTPPTTANASATFDEDTVYRFSPTDFPFADADAGNILRGVRITQLPTVGQLFLDANGDDLVDVGEAVTVDQDISLKALDLLGQLKFKPAANANGNNYDSFQFQVSDGRFLSAAPGTFTLNVTPVNDAPTGRVTITGTATQGQTLTASNTLADVDGIPGSILYAWLANGISTGVTSDTYTLTQADVGKVFTVRATYTDGGNTIERVMSAPTRAVVNVNDAPEGAVLISGNATQGQLLTASHTLTDADGLGPITYQWRANGVNLSGATASTLRLTQAQVGKAISVVARYTDRLGTPETVVSAATRRVVNINDAPTGRVTITGTATQGQILTASNTLADRDGLGPITYQWRADGVNLSGATASTLRLTQAQVGKAISVVARYTDRLGTPEAVVSTATRRVVNINDAPTGRVTITGIATQGQTLTASNTLADLDGLGPITYQWRADGVNLSGATASTLRLTQAQVGKAISVVARYTDRLGTPETVVSAATRRVVNINDAPTGRVTITGIATQGQTLTASNTLADLDGLGPITYQWRADGVNLSGATASTLRLTQAQVGKAISVVARYTDRLGTPEAVVSAATRRVVNINDAPTGRVTITGTATQGQTLTASNTLADLDGLGPITYQWRADGVNLSGATGNTLALTQVHVGKAISVVARYTDRLGTPESVASAATSAVSQPPVAGQITTLENRVLSVMGSTPTLTLAFQVSREARLNSTVGFYTVADTQGRVRDPLTGNLLLPGAAGYQRAALANRVVSNLTGQNGQTTSYTAAVATGQLLSSFLVVDGSVAALLDSNPNNDPRVFFNHRAANGDRQDHVRLLGSNTFGFEDTWGGGDRDFNDVIVRTTLA